MIGIVAAISRNGIIGNLDTNKLPFDYPADMAHFRKLTSSSIIIMGRYTFLGIGKPLPKRRNIVITSSDQKIAGVETFTSVEAALNACKLPVEGLQAYVNTWLIGGFRIYQEGMQYADELHLTLTPDMINNHDAVYFPWINPLHFQVKEMNQLMPGDDTLIYTKYERTIGNTIFAQKHFGK